MYARYFGPLTRSGALALAFCAATFAPAALAQEEAPGKRTTIVIEPDGRVIVDGKEMEGDGHGMLRFEGPEGDVLILRPGAGPFRDGRTPLRFRLEDGAFFDSELLGDEIRRSLDDVRIFSEPFGAFGPLHDDLAALAGETEDIMRLERETRDLARQIRRAEGAERTRLERELRDRLSETFDEKMQARRERLQRHEDSLEEERGDLQQRERAKAEIVQRRFNELLGEDDALDW